MSGKKYVFFIVMMLIGGGFFSAPVSAENPPSHRGDAELLEISGAYLEESGQSNIVTLVILLEHSRKPNIFSIDNPLRLVVDIPNAYASKTLPGRISPKSSLLTTGIRIGEDKEKQLVRFVFDLHSGNEYDIAPRLYVPEGGDSDIKLVVTVTMLKSVR